MQQTYSSNDLLQLIYDEYNDCCTDYHIRKELLSNERLAAEYRELKAAISLLKSHEIAPKSSSIETILSMSKSNENQLA